jgi:hypothetical protein
VGFDEVLYTPGIFGNIDHGLDSPTHKAKPIATKESRQKTDHVELEGKRVQDTSAASKPSFFALLGNVRESAKAHFKKPWIRRPKRRPKPSAP